MKLGDLLEQVDERNREGSTTNLLGVAIEKRFMPSVANVIGTDLSKYKLVIKDRFACNPMHVGRDEKLPIARYDGVDDAIVSPAYFTFEVSNGAALPRYLELWFNRPEFDRRCWFATDASVRGGLSWDALCDIPIQLPSSSEQQATVDRFDAIDRRISQLKLLNDKLASAMQLFFSARLSAPVGTDLPDGWRAGCLGDVATIVMGQSPAGEKCNRDGEGVPLLNGPTEFGEYSPTPAQWTTDPKKYAKETDLLFCVRGSTTGRMNWSNMRYAIGRGLAAIRHKTDPSLNWYVRTIIDTHLQEILASATGSTFPNVNAEMLASIPIVIPDERTIDEARMAGAGISRLTRLNALEIKRLQQMQTVQLSNLASGR